MHAIDADNLRREYSPGRGLVSLSLSVAGGECLALLGPNGSGKSTLIRLLAGLETPDAGELRVLGVDVAGGSRGHLGRMGLAWDRPVLWETLSGRANLRFIARSYGMSARAAERRVDELLAEADLSDVADEPAETYSYGMRRKLGIASAVAHEPELLVIDEPSAGVDAHYLARLAGRVAARSRGGRATLLAGNDADWMARVADRVALIDAGRIAASGTVDELLSAVGEMQEIRIELEAAIDLPASAIDGVESLACDEREVVALGPAGRELTGAVVNAIASRGGRIRRLEVRRPTLRDAYLLHTGRGVSA